MLVKLVRLHICRGCCRSNEGCRLEWVQSGPLALTVVAAAVPRAEVARAVGLSAPDLVKLFAKERLLREFTELLGVLKWVPVAASRHSG